MTVDMTGVVQPAPPLPSYTPLLDALREGYKGSLPDVGVLKGAIDRFMEVFDREGREAEMKRRRGENEGDDGWTVVRRKRGRGAEAEAMEEVKRREERKRAKVANVKFYRFAKREEKEKQLGELKRKFEEDKRKVAAMKAAAASRKFNPT